MRASAEIRQRARELRHEPTQAEDALWEQLRGHRLSGLKFRRQHPIGSCIADFCCVERRLIVEVDGPIHLTQAERDESRTFVLEQHGYTVLRLTNDVVLQNMTAALETILEACCADGD